MSGMNTKQLTEYLKMAAELEISVYKQEKTWKEADKNLVRRTLMEPHLAKAYKTVISYDELLEATVRGDLVMDRKVKRRGFMDRPAVREKVSEDWKLRELVEPLSELEWIPNQYVEGYILKNPYVVCLESLVWFGMGAVFTLLCYLLLNMFSFVIPAIFVALGILWACVRVSYARKICKIKKLVSEVLPKIESYCEEKYEREKQEKQNEYEIDKKYYDKNVVVAEKNFAKAQTEVQRLGSYYYETRKLLDRLYAADIIFAKYRNAAAICRMYEYFVSGRCTELTGSSGAYNLYEQELRQNLIISQLESINVNLEQIKQNQYMLYQGIQETNETLKSISLDIKSLSESVNEIATASRVTAYYAQITAENTKAIKYLEMLS